MPRSCSPDSLAAFAGKTDGATGSSLSLDTPLVAGRASLLVLAKGAGTGALGTSGGTFGLEMALVEATTPLFETTQGIGGLVDVRKASIPSEGRYDITLTDLDAPAPFNDLMLVISRGAQKIATLLVGSGSATANTATSMRRWATTRSRSSPRRMRPRMARRTACRCCLRLARRP